MDETKSMLRAIINGQSAMKQQLLGEIHKVDDKVEKLDQKVENLGEELKKVESNLTKRITKIGLQVARLEDDTPTREEFDDLASQRSSHCLQSVSLGLPLFNKEAHMSKPVHLLVLAQGFTEAWYQLSKEEQDNLWSQVQEVDKRAGVKWLISCDSRWADESVYGWAVLEYPDMDTYQKKAKELEELKWWRYFSAKTILGTKDESNP